MIRVADPSTANQLAKRIDALFSNSPNETKTSTEKAWVSDFAGQIGDIGAIVIRIAALVMGLILFVTGNAMAQSIRERINELGVLKTLGFGDGRILALVLLESCTLALIGGWIGLAIAWVDRRAGRSDRWIPAGVLLPGARSRARGRPGVRAWPGNRHHSGAAGEPVEDR